MEVFLAVGLAFLGLLAGWFKCVDQVEVDGIIRSQITKVGWVIGSGLLSLTLVTALAASLSDRADGRRQAELIASVELAEAATAELTCLADYQQELREWRAEALVYRTGVLSALSYLREAAYTRTEVGTEWFAEEIQSVESVVERFDRFLPRDVFLARGSVDHIAIYIFEVEQYLRARPYYAEPGLYSEEYLRNLDRALSIQYDLIEVRTENRVRLNEPNYNGCGGNEDPSL